MSTEATTPAPVELVNVQIDGVWHQISKGTRLSDHIAGKTSKILTGGSR